MEKPFKVRLHVLSPVHIGCDETYEPTEFIIDERRKKLIDFDPMVFVQSLAPQESEEFSKICSGDNLFPILKSVRKYYRPQPGDREVEIASGLVEHYRKVMSDSFYSNKDVVTQFSINKTAHHPTTGLPYIPGSSLKGALRTAYLSGLAKARGIKNRKERAKDLEIELLGGQFQTDPFRLVKISDLLPVTAIQAKVVYAVNKKKKVSKYEARGPFQILETVLSGTFEGIVNVEVPEPSAHIDAPVIADELFAAANEFYLTELRREAPALKEIGASGLTEPPILSHPSAVLIRIGRHSGAEAVIIAENRHIKIMQANNQPAEHLDHATTFWLASLTSKPLSNMGLVPFGWAVLEVNPFDRKEGVLSQDTLERIAPMTSDLKTPTAPAEERQALVTAKESEPVLWANAFLKWNPGNQTLMAATGDQKAEKKIGTDRLFVPERLHKRLFDKRKSVNADVTVRSVGNAFEIVKVD